MLGSLAMMAWLAMTPHSPQTEKKRLGILAGFAFFTGNKIVKNTELFKVFKWT